MIDPETITEERRSFWPPSSISIKAEMEAPAVSMTAENGGSLFECTMRRLATERATDRSWPARAFLALHRSDRWTVQAIAEHFGTTAEDVRAGIERARAAEADDPDPHRRIRRDTVPETVRADGGGSAC